MDAAEQAQLKALLYGIAADRIVEQQKWTGTLTPPPEHFLALAQLDQRENEIRARLAQIGDIPSPTVAGRLDAMTTAIMSEQAEISGMRAEWRQHRQIEASERRQGVALRNGVVVALLVMSGVQFLVNVSIYFLILNRGL